MPEIPVRAVAVIHERLSGAAYRVALPNGKKAVGHLARSLREDPPDFAPGIQVSVELTPYDFSQARITGQVEPDGAVRKAGSG